MAVVEAMAMTAIIGVPPPLAPYLPPVTVLVVTPCFNGERWLRECVESVVAQTFTDWAMVLVDDGSTDGSWREMSRLVIERPERHFLVTRTVGGPLGCGAARNKGVGEYPTSDWILPLDCDDMLTTDALERLLSHDDGECGWIIPDIQQFGNINERTRIPDDAPGYVLEENRLCGTSLIRRKMWDHLGGYRTYLEHIPDWDLWCRATMSGYKPIVSHEPVFLYRRHPDAMTSNRSSWRLAEETNTMREGWNG